MDAHTYDCAGRLPHLAALAMAKLAYSMDEAVLVSGWSRAGLYRAIESGELRSAGSGARRVILREDLLEFLRKRRDLVASVTPTSGAGQHA